MDVRKVLSSASALYTAISPLRRRALLLTMQPGSQTSKILAYLKAGKRLTPMDALALFGCFRLSGRILDLRRAGHKVITEMLPLPNGKTVAEYRLE